GVSARRGARFAKTLHPVLASVLSQKFVVAPNANELLGQDTRPDGANETGGHRSQNRGPHASILELAPHSATISTLLMPLRGAWLRIFFCSGISPIGAEGTWTRAPGFRSRRRPSDGCSTAF